MPSPHGELVGKDFVVVVVVVVGGGGGGGGGGSVFHMDAPAWSA